MSKTVSRKAKLELVSVMRPQYQAASWKDKVKILDGLIAATGYDRKYAIRLLNKPVEELKDGIEKKPSVPRKYDERVKQALLTVWYAANQICSKRLVPFLPDFVESLERHGHLRLPEEVKVKLLTVSPATVDRLLQSERRQIRKSPTTTKPGNLLKHQIKVRTFSDWEGVAPGFLEVDTLAHCGGDLSGQYLNTLFLVDICTGWVEMIPLLRKSAADVIAGFKIVAQLLPFPILGLDCDNGMEFINHEVLNFCEEHRITFTRSRAYQKNDQAHVEEKNGSIIRRLVGYDRFEGRPAWLAMSELYRYLRQYINFFQPSMKLKSKSRQGAKVAKKYHLAQTPYKRILQNESISENIKKQLEKQYLDLDPIWLMEHLEHSQQTLFKYGWMPFEKKRPTTSENTNGIIIKNESIIEIPKIKYYPGGNKLDGRSKPRTWRTRKDVFEDVWSQLKLKLELNPQQTAKSLLEALIENDPIRFNMKQLRTLQRRVREWREKQTIYESQIQELLKPSPNPQQSRVMNKAEPVFNGQNVAKNLDQP